MDFVNFYQLKCISALCSILIMIYYNNDIIDIQIISVYRMLR